MQKFFCKNLRNKKKRLTFVPQLKRQPNVINKLSRSSSVGRAQPCQGWGREFESRLLLLEKPLLLEWLSFLFNL